MAKIKRNAKNLESSDNVKQKNTVKQVRKPENKTAESKTKANKSENSPILENNERKLRSCVVKLRRTHETPINIPTTKNKQFADKRKAASKTKQPAKGAAQGDVVDIVKEKSLVDNCNNELRQPATPSIRACVVRVQRTPNQNPSTPFIVPTIDEQKRRRLSKLSLTKKTRQLVQSLAETDNEISLFEPARNSTLHAEALKATTNEANEQKDEDARRTHDVNSNSLSKHDNSSKNLTNRSDIIEQILLSVENDDDDDAAVPSNNNNNQKSHAVPPNDNNKTQKFFHRTNNATTNDAPPPTAPTTSRSAKSIDTIYEFLSQSQTSDSDIGKPKDPTADIVKKLIEEGRVLVAAPVKGCGKSRVKSRGVRKAKDKVAKVKKPAARRGRKLKKKEEIEKIIELSENESDHDQDHHGDHGDNNIDDELPTQPSSPIEEIENNENIVQEAPVVNDSRSHHGDQHAEGTFSNLARSVLMQQTEKNRVNQRQRLLLEQARKIISTPVQRKATPRAAASATMTPPQAAASALHLSNLSPIHYLSNARINPNSTSKPQPQQSPLGNSSPWRAPDESRHLPSVFHFSRGSSNLPSFSSDYIPATPQKPKRYVNKYASLGENTINDDAEDNDGNNGNKDLPAAVGGISSSNIISSFSSNDSNAENMPPPKKSIMHDKPSTSAAAARLAQSAIATAADENENIFNSRQMPNPRRTLAHRSPLKAINIQEVVMLPSWKPNEPNKPAANVEKPATDSHNVSIFGFDEYLDADSSFAEPTEKQQTTEKQQNISNNNDTIRNKLKELRKYRPKTKEVRINHQPKLSRDAAKVFDEPGGKPTQRHIKEMLCSTMIHGTKPSLDMPNNANSSGNAIDHLFNDVELSFNEENPHRTYVAPVKRKRKLRNQFAMFLDSDCSEDDESGGSGDDFVDGNKKKTSDKHAVQKKKKQRKEATATAAKKHENQEFKEFLNSFNEMCKEVEEYQLIVEKSA